MDKNILVDVINNEEKWPRLGSLFAADGEINQNLEQFINYYLEKESIVFELFKFIAVNEIKQNAKDDMRNSMIYDVMYLKEVKNYILEEKSCVGCIINGSSKVLDNCINDKLKDFIVNINFQTKRVKLNKGLNYDWLKNMKVICYVNDEPQEEEFLKMLKEDGTKYVEIVRIVPLIKE